MEKYDFKVAINNTIYCYDFETGELLGSSADKFEPNDSDFWARFDDINDETFDLNLTDSGCFIYVCSVDDNGYLTGECVESYPCSIYFETLEPMNF